MFYLLSLHPLDQSSKLTHKINHHVYCFMIMGNLFPFFVVQRNFTVTDSVKSLNYVLIIEKLNLLLLNIYMKTNSSALLDAFCCLYRLR